jgi:hypothetical protein
MRQDCCSRFILISRCLNSCSVFTWELTFMISVLWLLNEVGNVQFGLSVVDMFLILVKSKVMVIHRWLESDVYGACNMPLFTQVC